MAGASLVAEPPIAIDEGRLTEGKGLSVWGERGAGTIAGASLVAEPPIAIDATLEIWGRWAVDDCAVRTAGAARPVSSLNANARAKTHTRARAVRTAGAARLC